MGFYAKLGVLLGVLETGLLPFALASLLLSGVCSIYYLRWLLSDTKDVPMVTSLQAGIIGLLGTGVCLVSLDLASARLRTSNLLHNRSPLTCPLATSCRRF